MDSDKLKQLRIQPEAKRRSSQSLWVIVLLVLGVTAAAVYFAWPRADDNQRVVNTQTGKEKVSASATASAAENSSTAGGAAASSSKPKDGVVLTVSGYIINRERIELSPRFMGVVKWIGVKKGDAVTNGQVVVLLDDAEYKTRLAEAESRIASAQAAVATARIAVPDSEARLAQAEARLASARASAEKAEIDFQRADKLVRERAEPQQLADDTRLRLDAARAAVREAEAALQSARLAPDEARARLASAQSAVREAEAARATATLFLDWTVIRSPIDGVVLEKLVDPNELVVPQSFGGARGPSTALIALANPRDLQVEIDLGEADLAKISLNQPCRVSPEAYPDKTYEGFVAEIAPEANRAKGTLQIKVQIKNPDRFLTPELSAKVDFLAVPTKP
ncbi:MAG: efflux RND transporter periplasmic adaptor subunit [Verrucomicrobia bacterium]|nr:efflux RND transporter periplasmic adaptor subunit [Verrucomicrobiota bacterium]